MSIKLTVTKHNNNEFYPYPEAKLTTDRPADKKTDHLLERDSRRFGALHVRPEASELCERLMWCRKPPAPSKRALSSWSNRTALVGDWAALGDWLVLGEGSPELSPESRLLLAVNREKSE